MFTSDLKLGMSYELEALKLFNFKSFVQSTGNFKEYDLKLIEEDGTVTLVEVKCDRLAINTGNIAIEYMCNNKPSGISTTKSNYYVYYVIGLDIVYKIPTVELLNICIGFKTINGGDRYRSKMYLIPMKYLYNYKINLISL